VPYAPAEAQQYYKGSIEMSEGNIISFEYTGLLDEPYECYIEGEMGSSEVRYSFSEIDGFAVVQMDDNGDLRDAMILNNGESFPIRVSTIGDGDRASICWESKIKYVFSDPVTGELNEGEVDLDNVKTVRIGESTGRMKKNPNTGEYFPAEFVYDPYTGDELVWSDDNR
jgi:hypothetical protein